MGRYGVTDGSNDDIFGGRDFNTRGKIKNIYLEK